MCMCCCCYLCCLAALGLQLDDLHTLASPSRSPVHLFFIDCSQPSSAMQYEDLDALLIADAPADFDSLLANQNELEEITPRTSGYFLSLQPPSPPSAARAGAPAMPEAPLLPPISPVQRTAVSESTAAVAAPNGARSEPVMSADNNNASRTTLASSATGQQHHSQHEQHQGNSASPSAGTDLRSPLLSELHSSPAVSRPTAARLPPLRAVHDKRRRSPESVLPTLSTMKRRRTAASRAVYAHKTSSVGSQYQARIEPWDANVAGQIQREQQHQQSAPNENRQAGSANTGDVEGQPYFLSSLLPDTTADQSQSGKTQSLPMYLSATWLFRAVYRSQQPSDAVLVSQWMNTGSCCQACSPIRSAASLEQRPCISYINTATSWTIRSFSCDS